MPLSGITLCLKRAATACFLLLCAHPPVVSGQNAFTTGRATYFARQYSDCRLLPLHYIPLENMTFKLRRNLLGIA